MEEVIGRWIGIDRVSKVSVEIVVSDQRVKRSLSERIGMVFVLDEEGFCCAIEDQRFRPFLKDEWMRWMA